MKQFWQEFSFVETRFIRSIFSKPISNLNILKAFCSEHYLHQYRQFSINAIDIRFCLIEPIRVLMYRISHVPRIPSWTLLYSKSPRRSDSFTFDRHRALKATHMQRKQVGLCRPQQQPPVGLDQLDAACKLQFRLTELTNIVIFTYTPRSIC